HQTKLDAYSYVIKEVSSPILSHSPPMEREAGRAHYLESRVPPCRARPLRHGARRRLLPPDEASGGRAEQHVGAAGGTDDTRKPAGKPPGGGSAHRHAHRVADEGYRAAGGRPGSAELRPRRQPFARTPTCCAAQLLKQRLQVLGQVGIEPVDFSDDAAATRAD